MTTILSPIKWTGSKRYLAPSIKPLFPQYKRVIDPFIGGGNMIPYYEGPVLAADSCQPLITLWDEIKYKPAALMKSYRELYNTYKVKGYEFYYTVRDIFNKDQEIAAAFLFLSRNSVNGLIRFNSKGEFNASAHVGGRNGMHPDKLEKIVFNWSDTYLKNVTFKCQDFEESLKEADKDTFVFLDPPYLESKSKMYQGNFDHNRLFNRLETLDNWILTFDNKENTEQLRYDILEKRLGAVKTELSSGTSQFNQLKGIRKEITESVYAKIRFGT